MRNLLKKKIYVRQLWSLEWPLGIPIDALCREHFFCSLLNYFLSFLQFFIVLFDLQKKRYWNRVSFPFWPNEKGKICGNFSRKEWASYYGELCEGKGQNIIWFLLSLFNPISFRLCDMSSVLSWAVRIPFWFKLVAWTADYSHNTGKILSLGFI